MTRLAKFITLALTPPALLLWMPGGESLLIGMLR